MGTFDVTTTSSFRAISNMNDVQKTGVTVSDKPYFSLVGKSLLYLLGVFSITAAVALYLGGQPNIERDQPSYLLYAWPPNLFLRESLEASSFSAFQVHAFLTLTSLLSAILAFWYVFSVLLLTRAKFVGRSTKAMLIYCVAAMAAPIIASFDFTENAGLFGFGLQQPMMFNIAKGLFLILAFYVSLQFFSYLACSSIANSRANSH